MVHFDADDHGRLLVCPASNWRDEHDLAEAYRNALREGRRQRLTFAQLLLPEGDRDQGRAAELAGFERITRIQMMETFATDAIHDARTNRSPDVPFSWQTHWNDEDAALLSVLEETYRQSRDVPEIHRWRSVEQAVAGHRMQAAPGLPHWQTLRFQEKRIGALCTAVDRTASTLRIEYLGLAPDWRGKRLGAAMVEHSFEEAKRVGLHKLEVHVDVRNEPAVRLYRRCGFVATFEVELFLAGFDSLEEDPPPAGD